MIIVEDIEQLGLAYRKAKADLYYSSDPSIEKIAKYEDNLYENLSHLQDRINGESETWINSSKFLGSWTLAPKSVDISKTKASWKSNGNGLHFSSPTEEWKIVHSQSSTIEKARKPDAEFRLMANCSMDLHVLSTLWILNVGHLLDAELQACAYGNRLRRMADGGKINELSLGTFNPYLKPFRDWHDHGIEAMQDALDSDKNIFAITADVSSFYHELNAMFLLDPAFIQDVLSLELSPQQQKLNRLFIKALEQWANATPLKKGLPVGLPASAIIANLALIELDRVIKRELTPIFYGRYVDDILLVVDNTSNFQSAEQLWRWIFDRTGDFLNQELGEQEEIVFRTSYLEDSRCKVRFINSKNKVFSLSGATGKTLLSTISHQIQERTYDWGAMPQIPQSSIDVGTGLLSALQCGGTPAGSLQEIHEVTIKRAEFALRLRDLEACERDLHPDNWREPRHAFFSTFIRHVLILPQFFELATYLPRIIGMATSCEDFEELSNILDSLHEIDKAIENDCTVIVKAFPSDRELASEDFTSRWRKSLIETVATSIYAAFPTKLSEQGEHDWYSLVSNHSLFKGQFSMTVEEASDRYTQLFSYDLAYVPFRFIGFADEMVSQRGIPKKEAVIASNSIKDLLPSKVWNGTKVLSNRINLIENAHGLHFSTRPYSLAELSLFDSFDFNQENMEFMNLAASTLRGYQTNSKMPKVDKDYVLQVPHTSESSTYQIAVSSWNTKLKSLEAAVNKTSDKDYDRYRRLNQMIDSLISEPEECSYLILPELSLPARWFMRIAGKLHRRGISLIAGVEYLHQKPNIVRNQVWASLKHDGLGFSSFIIYRQDKQRAAPGEEQNLFKKNGLKLVPEVKWAIPPIIQHGNFRFSMLVCSEFTNIGNRSALPGKIDALFVPEWNRDTESFNALVKSAALDIHAYIIQCNDRKFGDSRIRAPYKNSWERDVLRVTGGVSDYYAIGQIDTGSLRKFQSNFRSPEKPFKPVPDGFEICPTRKIT